MSVKCISEAVQLIPMFQSFLFNYILSHMGLHRFQWCGTHLNTGVLTENTWQIACQSTSC